MLRLSGRDYLPLVLGTAWPFVSFLNTNRFESLDQGRLALWGGAFLIGMTVVLILMCALMRKQHPGRIASTLALVAMLFWGYHIFVEIMAVIGITRPRFLLLGYALLTVVLVIGAWLIFASARARKILLLATATMVALPLVDYTTFAMTKPRQKASPSLADMRVLPSTAAARKLPNIYFFILDEYGRADVLKELTGLDITPFLDAMQRRGFVNIERSHSNFGRTNLSIAMTLAMDHVYPVGRGGALSSIEDASPYSSWMLVNSGGPAMARLREKGYKYVYARANTAVGTSCHELQEFCIRGKGGIDEFQATVLGMTPFLLPLRVYFPNYMSYLWLTPEDVVDALPGPEHDPIFVFAHILQPHSPYVYHADCSPRYDSGAAEWNWIAHNAWSSKLDLQEVIPLYRDSVTCLNSRLPRVTDRILARDPDAIIIMQGDHGTFFVNFDATKWRKPNAAWTDEENEERLANLSLIRLPEECRYMAYPTMTSVNTMRVVLACLEGRAPDLVPDVSYRTSPDIVAESLDVLVFRDYTVERRISRSPPALGN